MDARVIGPGEARWRQLTSGRTHWFTPWKFNWLANHKLVRALERARTLARGELLDVGCGSRTFAYLFEGRVQRYWGTDLVVRRPPGPEPPDAYASAEAQPFRAATFDTVIGLSLINYLADPGAAIAEAVRVLKPGGMLIFEFAQMVPVEYEPHDYFRFTRHGAELLLRRAGLEPVEFIPVGGLWARVGLSMIAALNRMNRGPTRVLTEVPVRLLYIVIQLGFDALDRMFFDPREVLAHLVVARRPR